MTSDRSDNSQGNWHLSKEVPISIIFTLLVQAAAGIVFATKLDARVGALESAKEATKLEQHERDERQDNALREANRALAEQLDRMNQKLDRLIERTAIRNPERTTR